MSPTRRMSLRARMLVIIVGVTTMLLLIMGTVSTYLFVRRVDGQAAAATRRLNQLANILVSQPQDAEANAQTASVVEISFQSRVRVVELTTGPATRKLSVAVAKWLTSQPIVRAQALAHSGQPLKARDLLAAGGCQHFPQTGQTIALP